MHTPHTASATRWLGTFVGLWMLAYSFNAFALRGVVVDATGKPVAGAVVYVLDDSTPVRVVNNRVQLAEQLSRAVTDKTGAFNVEMRQGKSTCAVLVRDMNNQLAYAEDLAASKRARIKMPASGTIEGTLFQGPKPLAGKKIDAVWTGKNRALVYSISTQSSTEGTFRFAGLMPGPYRVQTTESVPQVGCCFRAVVTNSAEANVAPGATQRVSFGGTSLPVVKGRIQDAQGNPLHGVWVSLKPKGSDNESESIWSTVTAKDGTYAIYDVPPGDYALRLFRRLALNTATRTFDTTKALTVRDTDDSGVKQACAANDGNATVELASFMPLALGQPAPAIEGVLESGAPFSLAAQRGKVVVIHAFAGWCAACMAGIEFFDALQDRYGKDKVIVLGIDLDQTREDCLAIIAAKHINHAVLYAGQWDQSTFVKEYRISDIPSTFVIDQAGTIAQLDLFDETLAGFVEELLKNAPDAQGN